MPSAPGYKRNYKQELKTDRKRGGVKDRALRNKARRQLMREGKVHKGDQKDVDHKQALSKGGGYNRENLRVTLATENRSFKRNKSGSLVSQTSDKERKKKK